MAKANFKTNNWESRDKKRDKKHNGMRVHGKNMLRIEQDLAIRNQRKLKEEAQQQVETW